jgi:hypothetical protein
VLLTATNHLRLWSQQVNNNSSSSTRVAVAVMPFTIMRSAQSGLPNGTVSKLHHSAVQQHYTCASGALTVSQHTSPPPGFSATHKRCHCTTAVSFNLVKHHMVLTHSC